MKLKYLIILLLLTIKHQHCIAQDKNLLAFVSYDSILKNMPEYIYVEAWKKQQEATLQDLIKEFEKSFKAYQVKCFPMENREKVEKELFILREKIDTLEKETNNLHQHKIDSINPIVKEKVKQIAQKIALQQGISLIINRDKVNVHLYDDAIDLTKEIIEQDTTIYDVVEQMPQWEAGMAGFSRYLMRNLKIENTKIEDLDLCSKLVISFVVEKDASITNINFVKPNPCFSLTQIIAIFQKAKLTAGKHHNYPKRVRMRMPIVVCFRKD